MKCNKERIKNVKQNPCVDADLGIAEENHNEFWKEKKEEHKNFINSK